MISTLFDFILSGLRFEFYNFVALAAFCLAFVLVVVSWLIVLGH